MFFFGKIKIKYHVIHLEAVFFIKFYFSKKSKMQRGKLTSQREKLPT